MMLHSLPRLRERARRRRAGFLRLVGRQTVRWIRAMLRGETGNAGVLAPSPQPFRVRS